MKPDSEMTPEQVRRRNRFLNPIYHIRNGQTNTTICKRAIFSSEFKVDEAQATCKQCLRIKNKVRPLVAPIDLFNEYDARN